MKAFVSVDLEGMPYIVVRGQLNLKGSLYKEAREIATKITLLAATELHKNGFDEVVVADSHGPMVNILVERLPEYVELVRGYPRPTSMIACAEGCDAGIFLGYHAKFGTIRSTFDHTYAGSVINRLEINGLEASEFLFNAYGLGELGVPLMLVAGDQSLLTEDVKKQAPWVETVALKTSLGRVAARSYGLPRLERELRQAIKKATAKLASRKTKLIVPKKPVRMHVTFIASHFADVAELLPFVKRLDGLNIEYVSKNMIEAYRTFEAIVLASIAMNTILEKTG